MIRRWTRFVVTAAVGLALWLATSDARASAPMCDHRGASANAPPPTLDTPQTSTEIDSVPRPTLACAGGVEEQMDAGATGALHRSLPRAVADSDMPACALPPPVPFAAPSPTELSPVATHDGPRAGARQSLERPPRLA